MLVAACDNRPAVTADGEAAASNAKALLQSVGANVKSSVSKYTNILIEGDQDNANLSEDGISTKKRKCMNLKAQGWDIEVIDEVNFLKMLET